MVKFTEVEKKVLLDFLDELNEHFANTGCNDWEIENTPENKEFVQKVIRFAFKGKDCAEELRALKEQEDEDPDTIVFTDMVVLDYLIDKLNKTI